MKEYSVPTKSFLYVTAISLSICAKNILIRSVDRYTAEKNVAVRKLFNLEGIL